ncbi:MAG: hypothetical protein M1817_001805 [Caeruleum heppii]|nr:MAG: hypothetical protein M1817_001805 [Caeruleum heppii]
MIPQFILASGVAYLIWSLFCMESNVRRARLVGVPVVRMPIDPMNKLWLVFEPPLFRLLDCLPFDYGTFGRYSRRGWHFQDKARSHLEFGPAWIIATPRELYLQIADPDAINDIFARRADFVRPLHLYRMLDVYGSNVSTVGGIDWQRQRKIVAAPFNENTNKLVWAESLSQTRDMLRSWSDWGPAGLYGVAKDTRTLSLDVLAATGFNRSYKFRSAHESSHNAARDYRDSLQIVLDNALLLMVTPGWLWSLPFVSTSWARIRDATTGFRQYMMDMLTEESSLLRQGKPGTGSLMTSFVRALEIHKDEAIGGDEENESPAQKGLSVNEILGNIFVINFAGHDTTANTLAFGMLLLAAYPEVQNWVAEELQEILGDTNSETWDYSKVYPRLKRSQAVLYETIRLYPPIMALPKWTNQFSQTLRVGEKTLSLPSRTAVLPSLLAVQTLPQYWSEDHSIWRPARWVLSSGPEASKSDLSGRSGKEELFTPRKGTYFPWSDGPQSCPGKKFAQVEFVAVIACLLQHHRVRLVPAMGEDWNMARLRTLKVLEDCDQGLLLRMRYADSVKLAWGRV